MEVRKKSIYYVVVGIVCIPVVILLNKNVNLWKDEASLDTQAEMEVTVTKPFFAPHQLPDGKKIYLNKLLKFSVIYPDYLDIEEYGQGNTSTIVFEDVNKKEGFQVFVVPYDKQVVSDERFKMDVPSGVMLEPTDVLVDGQRATMFFSRNSLLGETREVWFIKDGFLYEITVRKDLDEWLGQIISNWKFI